MTRTSGPATYRDALAELISDGYEIGEDKFNRFKPFGIETERTPGELERFVSADTFRRLKHILDIERKRHCERDRDRLAFELAALGYEPVPYNRVQAYVAKRLRRYFGMIRRGLQRFGSGTANPNNLHPRRVPSLADLFARRVIGDKPGLAHELKRQALSAVIGIFLRSAFAKGDIEPAAFRRILLIIGFPQNDADKIAADAARLWNSGRFMIRATKDGTNELLTKLDKNVPTDDVRAAIKDAELLLPAFAVLKKPLGLDKKPLEPYDVKEDMDHFLHVALVGVLIAERNNDNAIKLREEVRNGKLESVIDPLEKFVETMELCKKIFELRGAA